MSKRLTLLLCACAFVFLAACGGSKTGTSSYDSGDYDGREPPPKANELKESRDEANKLTEENHKMAREIFELKNRMGLSTDE
jgi:hypothetical protein